MSATPKAATVAGWQVRLYDSRTGAAAGRVLATVPGHGVESLGAANLIEQEARGGLRAHEALAVAAVDVRGEPLPWLVTRAWGDLHTRDVPGLEAAMAGAWTRAEAVEAAAAWLRSNGYWNLDNVRFNAEQVVER